MRKLVLEEWMSLDGFVEDQEGKTDYFTSLTPEQNKFSDRDQLDFLETVDTILLGRKTYQLFAAFWPTADPATEIIADRLNAIKKLVFSNTLLHAPWGHMAPLEIIHGDAVEAIKKLKVTPGKNMVMWGSISLAQACIHANLVDEYHIQLCPILTGGGRRLFPGLPGYLNLSLTSLKQYETGVTCLRYER